MTGALPGPEWRAKVGGPSVGPREVIRGEPTSPRLAAIDLEPLILNELFQASEQGGSWAKFTSIYLIRRDITDKGS
jgi:hypothetical protein